MCQSSLQVANPLSTAFARIATADCLENRQVIGKAVAGEFLPLLVHGLMKR
jgi:hypothetical protein